jgi:hypothetical protein
LLIERGLSKQDCFHFLDAQKIRLPEMYRLGFNNANCIGCPKGGMGYWNRVKRLFPERFEEMAALQRELAALMRNDEEAQQEGPGAPAFQAEQRRGFEGPSADEALSRLMQQTDSEMSGSETKRRQSAIAHLKAAVAATVADRKVAGEKSGETETVSRLARYRNDLAMAVKAALPGRGGAAAAPQGERPAPFPFPLPRRSDADNEHFDVDGTLVGRICRLCLNTASAVLGQNHELGVGPIPPNVLGDDVRLVRDNPVDVATQPEVCSRDGFASGRVAGVERDGSRNERAVTGHETLTLRDSECHA